MLEPLADVARWLRSLFPDQLSWSSLRKRRLNFITVHYIYLITTSLVCSVILYGSGLIPYVDALFFSAGASTQAGLNTININNLWLYQQVVLFFVACLTNPIFINTMVVFVRLYWFEKRFNHIVKEIRESRRSRAKGSSLGSRSKAKDESDLGRLEKGVNGREIKVLHETTQPNGMSGPTAPTHETEKFKEKMGLDFMVQSAKITPDSSNKSSEENPETFVADEAKRKDEEEHRSSPQKLEDTTHHLGLNPSLAFNRQITFADEVKGSENGDAPELARVPEALDISKHIEFLERQQRNAKDGAVLRIPGPRDFDRGVLPQHLDESDDDDMLQPRRTISLGQESNADADGRTLQDDEGPNAEEKSQRGGIRFNEQEHPGRRQEEDTIGRTTTTNSRFGLNRIRSGASNHNPLRHRRSNSNRLQLSEVRTTLGRTFSTVLSKDRQDDPMPYLSWIATTGRNSAFVGLTEKQREELGGIEYRSLKTLAKVLIIYFIGWHLFGLIINLPWILHKEYYRELVIRHGINPSWWAIFTSASEFNDLGFTLTPDSMNSFDRSTTVLLIGSLLIIVGNTGFPVMLRFVIWVASKFTPQRTELWEELKFLLDHPRRCFTLLFPSKATWWLFWVLVLLNCIDLVFFIILDLNDPVVTHLPPGFRVLDGWFQAVSTRTAGFSCVNLAKLHPAIQVSYLIMMYISVFPIAISVRRTNVYEEKSLGIFGGEEEAGENGEPSYVGQHLRRQLSFDLWYLFLGLFIICIVEGDRLQNNNEYAFTPFSVLFEIVSAYGTVGMSLGYPGIDASFSAEFKPLSKLIIIAMMIRGRHRGLPYALDRAILLPSEQLQKKEAEDADRRAVRRGSTFAEGREAEGLRHTVPWGQNDMDENGLPKQHLGPISSYADAAMSAGAGGEHDTSSRSVRRRPSTMSTASGKPGKHERSKSLSQLIASGLSAGPTWSKHD